MSRSTYVVQQDAQGAREGLQRPSQLGAEHLIRAPPRRPSLWTPQNVQAFDSKLPPVDHCSSTASLPFLPSSSAQASPSPLAAGSPTAMLPCHRGSGLLIQRVLSSTETASARCSREAALAPTSYFVSLDYRTPARCTLSLDGITTLFSSFHQPSVRFPFLAP
jgi:hypothetical protein